MSNRLNISIVSILISVSCALDSSVCEYTNDEASYGVGLGNALLVTAHLLIEDEMSTTHKHRHTKWFVNPSDNFKVDFV